MCFSPPPYRCLDRKKLNQASLCLTLLSVIPLTAPSQLPFWQLFHIYHPEDNLDGYNVPSSSSDERASFLPEKPDFFPQHVFNKLCNLPVGEADLKNVIQSMSSQREQWDYLLHYESRCYGFRNLLPHINTYIYICTLQQWNFGIYDIALVH